MQVASSSNWTKSLVKPFLWKLVLIFMQIKLILLEAFHARPDSLNHRQQTSKKLPTDRDSFLTLRFCFQNYQNQPYTWKIAFVTSSVFCLLALEVSAAQGFGLSAWQVMIVRQCASCGFVADWDKSKKCRTKLGHGIALHNTWLLFDNTCFTGHVLWWA